MPSVRARAKGWRKYLAGSKPLAISEGSSPKINSYQLSLDAFHKTINNNSKTIKMLTAPLITYLHTNNKLSYIYSWTTSKIDNSAYHPGDRFGRKQPELSRI